MKKITLLLLLFATAYISMGQQPLGNEWINYNQQYFTVKVHEQGLYRVGYTALLNAGVPLGTFDPRSFQVFTRGVEQPIIVKNENTGVFQPGDFIEFFGEKNNGWFDKGFYADGSLQPNGNYSLVNDTATYYITWNNLLNNKRYILETDVSFQGYTPAPYFWNTTRQDYVTNYYAGATNNYGVTDPEYTQAQGWFDAPFTLGQSRSKTLPTPNPYLAGPQAEIKMAVAGASNYAQLNPDHHLRIQFAGQMIDTLYEGYKLLRFEKQLGVSNLNPAGTTFVFSSINDLGTTVDRNAIVYISVRYPHTFNLRNEQQLSMEVPPSAGSKTLIQFTNFNVGATDTTWVFDLSNSRRIPVVAQESTFSALLPNAGQTRNCLVTSSARVKPVALVRPVNTDHTNFARFQNFTSPANINSDYLMITHGSLMQAAENYKNYRNSTGYKVLLVDVNQLYHQFSYGISKHPIALRNFARFTIERYNSPPRKLFLIGKGHNTQAYRRSVANYANTLMPSFGDPSSDILITAGLLEGYLIPAIATGRLAARTPAQVNHYLEKIIQYEGAQNQPEEWMKNVLHFGGGSSLGEQAVLGNYLRQYEETISDTLFGGYVRTFLKSSTQPIQINQSDSLRKIINNGVALMTFFGHAAGIGFDISIDNPSEYNNYGKYPFLIANSCFAGDLFSGSISSSEEFVLIPNKGTIGYMGSTSSSGAFELNRYTNAFLRNLSGNQYGKPIGDNIKQVIREIESTNSYIKNICLMNVLHADPALIIYHQDKPDYKIIPENIFFTPGEVTTEIDHFTVNVISTNIGRSIRDSMMIELARTFPDGTMETFLKRIPGTMFKDTIPFTMQVDREKGIGLNLFTATLNAYNEIQEISLTNNTATTGLLVKSADVLPVFPHQYAIIPNSQVTLKASTGDPFLSERTYVFELDTSPRFNKPLTQKVTQSGGIISWLPPLSLTDSTVYFWRVSQDSTYTGSYSWRSSSFQYIREREGWSQAHFDQFAGNNYRYVNHNPIERQWDFVNNFLSIQAKTGVYPYIAWNEVWFKVNSVTIKTWSCLADVGNGLIIQVFDPVSGELWYTLNQGNNLGQYGNYQCYPHPMPGFDFYTSNEDWRNRARVFLDTIPVGHYVLVMSHRNHYAQSYSEELLKSFESIGSANVRNLVNNTPYMIFGRKGEPIGSANEVLGGTISSIIQLNDSLQTNWNQGHILSEVIGPAKSWESLHWEYESLGALPTDSVWMQVLGIRKNGTLDTLMSYIPSGEFNLLNLSQQIDASIYPHLQLKVNMRDDINRTPAQMKRWQVMYEGVPELAIDPHSHFYFVADTLPEGKELVFSTAIRNISQTPTDSLQVNYWIVDKARNQHPVEYPRQGPLLPGEALKDTIRVATTGLAGNNSLWMEVNPNQEQAEQYHFNNIGKIPFLVMPDESNPLLDVTFDGIRIMDGDIVSTQPLIRIILKDENQYRLLSDTTTVKVFLQTPTLSAPQRIYFHEAGVEKMRFYPASLPENSCVVEYQPELTQDGIYSLMIQATDGSLNESGKEDFSIRFEVVNRSTITEVLNWPNPFSTKTQFVFTLTGSELPTFFKIQIMTITGKVVREIDLNELGPLNIGRNVTQYAWDGTDQYGDRLANGVYLYRVITNINGDTIELNATDASRYFHKEFGKMYLIR